MRGFIAVDCPLRRGCWALLLEPVLAPSMSAGSGARLSMHRVWVQRGRANIHLKGVQQ